MDRLGIEQCPEDRGGEIAAVAPEGGLHTARIAGDEPGDDHRTVESGLDGQGDALVRRLPLHHRPERPRLDHDHFACIEPTDLATAACAARIELAEQAGRPDLTIPGDDIVDVARGRAGQAHGFEDAFDVGRIPVEVREPCGRGVGREQLSSDGGMAVTQRREPCDEVRILTLGFGHQCEQLVGHPLTGGQHDAEAARRMRLEDVGHALKTGGVSDAGSTELVYHPAGR